MKYFKSLLIIYIILTNFAGILYSQEKMSLTIDDALKLGIDNNITVKISKSKLESAEAKTKESESAMLPSLKLIAGYTRLSEVDPFEVTTPAGKFKISASVFDQYVTKLTVAQPIFTGFRLQSNADMMDYLAEASGKDLEKDKSQLIYDIKNAYWSYYKALDFKKNIVESITQMKAHYADLESFFRNGLATNNELLKVKVQLSNLELASIDADNAVQLSLLGLNNTLGLPLNTEIEIKSLIELRKNEESDLPLLKENAIKNRPELKALEYRVKASEAGVNLAKAGWYPQISIMGNYNYNRPNQRIMPTRDEFIGTWDVGLNFSFDIWNWQTTEHQTSQAQANLEQTQLGLKQLKDAVQLDITSSWLMLRKAKEKITVSELTVSQAEENLRVTNEKFQAGVAINSDLLDAETLLLQAKINYSGALVDYEIALAKLERAVGN